LALLVPTIGFAQSFPQAVTAAEARLDAAVARLGETQERIAEEKIPLATELNQLEQQVRTQREELARRERLRDTRDLNLAQLQKELAAKEESLDYAANLLIEFINNQASGSDAAERQLYEETFFDILGAADATESTGEATETTARLNKLLEGLQLGFERLDRIIGGHHFEGRAVLPDGTYAPGRFLLYGPVTYFAASEPPLAGITLPGDSGEPRLINLSDSYSGASATILEQQGTLPLDATLGKALAIETTRESLFEHIQKGGIWMIPILTVALVSLAIAAFKAFELFSIRTIPAERLAEAEQAVEARDSQAALHVATQLAPEAATVVGAVARHLARGQDAMEQAVEETLLRLRPKFERLLPLVWIAAATAPLLGLLGTVTGIIYTFRLLTIFGSGDPKALGGGISEALVTTEFGLIVAIPSLILHALLIRKARAIEGKFEADAMQLLGAATRQPQVA